MESTLSPAAPAGAQSLPSERIRPVADGEELTALHPSYKTLLRLQTVFVFIPILIGALIAEAILAAEGAPIPSGVIAGSLLLLAIVLVIRIPQRRFAARGYQMSDDRLRVVRGILWRSDTVVPFGRVQHIDVDQGPLERAFGIATMTLHTAGTHNASVDLPGLGEEHARDMREEIRAHIKRESL
ncbi:MAG: PH domain-containing protein [Erythrobacter sp.]|uniref:PH domain-containing protein n=1 Tax=Erythrobacter sp. TaxID=1042 RepID=UPI0032EB4DD3